MVSLLKDQVGAVIEALETGEDVFRSSGQEIRLWNPDTWDREELTGILAGRNGLSGPICRCTNIAFCIVKIDCCHLAATPDDECAYRCENETDEE